MRILKENLLVRFSVISFVVMAAIAVVIATVLTNKIQSGAIDELVDEAVGASSGRLISAITPADLEQPMTGDQYDRFHEFVERSIVSDRTARVKIRAKNGTIIYSGDQASVGKEIPPNEPLLRALRGETVSILKVPKDETHAAERSLGILMEVVTPIIFPGTSEPQGVFALYQYYGPTAARISDQRNWVFGLVGVGFVALYGALVSVVWGGWRTINSQRRRLESFNAELEGQVQARTAELVDTQEKLVRNERLAAIGSLAAGVAHELRNPLGGIKNTAFYIKSKLADSDLARENPKILEHLEMMHQEITSSNQIITDLMDFSRINPLEASPTNLESLVENTLSRAEVKENVRIIKNFPPDLPEVSVDGEQLRRAITNLVRNADDAMPEGGELTIGATARNGSVELQVCDTGHGIGEEELAKVFDPLFTTKAKGIGMGLAIVGEVIRKHNGTIDVTSKPGEGATFTIMLPLDNGSGPQDGQPTANSLGER